MGMRTIAIGGKKAVKGGKNLTMVIEAHGLEPARVP